MLAEFANQCHNDLRTEILQQLDFSYKKDANVWIVRVLCV